MAFTLWELDHLRLSHTQVNDLAARWIARLRARCTDLVTGATIDSADRVYVKLVGGQLHVQLTATRGQLGWGLAVALHDPHPSPLEQEWVVAELLAVAAALRLPLHAEA